MMKFGRLGLACLMVAASASLARADSAQAWFTLAPESGVMDRTAPFESFFYSRPAFFEGLARLTDAYDVQPGDPSKGEVPGGALLYAVHDGREIYYCSKYRLRAFNSSDAWGAVLRAPLAQFGVVPLASTDTLPQCFRDADGDGRFEEKAAAEAFGTIATAHSIHGSEDLSVPLAYQAMGMAGNEPPLEIGFMGKVRDAQAGKFTAAFCVQVKTGEFTADDLECFPRFTENFTAKDLPFKLNYLGGEITISSVSQDPDGAWQVSYAISKPSTKNAVGFVPLVNRSGFAGYSLVYRDR